MSVAASPPPVGVARGRGLLSGARVGDLVYFLSVLGACIAVALLIAAGVVALAGGEPGTVFTSMVRGSLGSTVALVATLNHAAPLLVVAIGALIAFRAGLVNIGLEGQLVIGAMCGAAVGLAVPGPGAFRVFTIFAAAALGGAVWAGIAAVLKYRYGIHEVLSTLLLNFVAFQLVSFAVNRPWLLQEDLPRGVVGGYTNPQSNPLPEAARLPAIVTGMGFRLTTGIVIAVLIALAVAFFLAKTRWGFELRMLGLNTNVARRSGVSPTRMGGAALLASGALAGVAGAILLMGTVFRLLHGFSNNYGWEGLLASLVGSTDALLAIPSALVFGALRAGGGVLAATGISQSLVRILQALVVLAVVLPGFLLIVRKRRRQRGAGAAGPLPAAREPQPAGGAVR